MYSRHLPLNPPPPKKECTAQRLVSFHGCCGIASYEYHVLSHRIHVGKGRCRHVVFSDPAWSQIEGRRRRRVGNRGWDGWMASPTQWTWVEAKTDGESWDAAVHGVAKSWTQLSDWTTTTVVIGEYALSLDHFLIEIQSPCSLCWAKVFGSFFFFFHCFGLGVYFFVLLKCVHHMTPGQPHCCICSSWGENGILCLQHRGVCAMRSVIRKV